MHALIVQQLKTQNVCKVKLSDIHGASLWQPRWVPASGTIIGVKQHGACFVLSVRKRLGTTRVYSYCMSTPLQEIRCRRIWHIALALHLHVHASVASESLAEVVASFLQTVKRRNLNHKNEHQEVCVGHPIEIHRTARHGWRRRNIEHGVEHTFFMQGPEWLACLCQKSAKDQSLTIRQSFGARCVC